MEWTEEVIDRLRALWSDGHSTAEIGRRLGVSKNAVVGKAHRLNLPARPSPIRREASAARAPAPRRVAGPTLPPLACAQLPAPEPAAGEMAPPARAPRPAPRPVAVEPPAERAAPRPFARVVTCCWPIGEPGTRSFRFCDAAAMSGKPYCAEHAALAYVKVKDRREDAA